MAIIKTHITEPEDEPVITGGIIPGIGRTEPEEPEGHVATAKPSSLKKVATSVCILFAVIVGAVVLFSNGLGLMGSSSKLNESTLFIQFDKSIRMTSLIDLTEKKIFNLQDSLDKATLIDDEVVTASLSLALEKNIDSYNGYIERLANEVGVLFQEYEKSQAQAEDKLLGYLESKGYSPGSPSYQAGTEIIKILKSAPQNGDVVLYFQEYFR